MMRFFGLILVLLLVFVGVGLYRDWFGISTAEAGGKSGIHISWDTQKIKEDMGKASSKIKAMSDSVVAKIKTKAKDVSATESQLEGRVTAVDVSAHTVTIDSDGTTIPLVVPENDRTELGQLVGKHVRVTLDKSGDSMIVREIREVR